MIWSAGFVLVLWSGTGEPGEGLGKKTREPTTRHL